MWLFPPVNSSKVTTEVLPRVSFQVVVAGFSSNPCWSLSLQSAPLPWQAGLFYHGSGAGRHRRTWAVSRGGTIKEPMVQSPAGGMSWWKLDEILHQGTEQLLAGWEAAWKNRIHLDLCIHWVGSVAVPVSQTRRISEHQELEWLPNTAAGSLFLETLTWTRPEQLDPTCKPMVLSARGKTKYPLEILPLQIHLKLELQQQKYSLLFSCFLCFLY